MEVVWSIIDMFAGLQIVAFPAYLILLSYSKIKNIKHNLENQEKRRDY